MYPQCDAASFTHVPLVVTRCSHVQGQMRHSRRPDGARHLAGLKSTRLRLTLQSTAGSDTVSAAGRGPAVCAFGFHGFQIERCYEEDTMRVHVRLLTAAVAAVVLSIGL